MAQIRILQPGDEALLEKFLAPRLSTSMFLASNMRLAGLQDSGERYQGTYAAAFEANRMIGVVVHFWNQTLIPQAPPDSLMPLAEAALKDSGRALARFIGPDDQVQALISGFGIKREQFQRDEREKLYELEIASMAVPEILGNAHFQGRRMKRDDMNILLPWRVAYLIEALSEEDTPELWQRAEEGLQAKAGQHDVWVLERDGELVATTGFNAAIPEAVQVGGVYTPPVKRRNGYARAVVAQSLLDAQADGARLAILFTADDNLPAQKAYEALGFKQRGYFRLSILKEPLSRQELSYQYGE